MDSYGIFHADTHLRTPKSKFWTPNLMIFVIPPGWRAKDSRWILRVFFISLGNLQICHLPGVRPSFFRKNDAFF